MKTLNSLALLTASTLLLAGCATTSSSRPHAANPADVGTIHDIVRASYEVLCGPAGVPRDWDRDRTLYMPGAMFVAVWVVDGALVKILLTPEAYRRGFKIGNGVYETEIGRRIERFGDVAQVRSVAVSRETPGGPIKARYVNYFHLYWDGTRWWITGMVWNTERPDAPIPESWVGTFEEIPRKSAPAATQ